MNIVFIKLIKRNKLVTDIQEKDVPLYKKHKS